MKKIIILSGVLCLLASASANARISVDLNFGEPYPAYIEAPEYVSPYPIYPTYAVEGDWHHRHDPHDRRRGNDHRGHNYRGQDNHRR